MTNATTQDILAILEARRIQAEKLKRSAETRVRATVAAADAVAAPNISAVTLAAPATPAPVTASPVTPDEVLEAFLSKELPGLMAAAQDLIRPPFAFAELRRAADEIAETVSYLVATGLPGLKGLDALALVQVLVRFHLRKYAQSVVPPLMYPMLERLVVAGIEWLYRTKVKPRLP